MKMLIYGLITGIIFGANIIGGLVFGAGWRLLGYCPGTLLGALGEGRLDALGGILGMLVGAVCLPKPIRC